MNTLDFVGVLSIAFEDSMTIADEDIDENWEFYKEKFLKGDIL